MQCASDAGMKELPNLEHDKDFLCPICIQLMRDAFLTSCGHSFCYMCIMTHLSSKSTCPCCGAYLTSNQLYPNFVLNKILNKALVYQLAHKASPAEYLRLALKQGAEISIKEIETLLLVLNEKKQKVEQEEAETNIKILLEFLHRSRNEKQQELNEVQADLQCLKHDIAVVEKRMLNYRRWKSKSCVEKREHCLNGKRDPEDSATELLLKKKRVALQFEDLQEFYLQKRRRTSIRELESYDSGLEELQDVLASISRYSQLRVVAEVRHPDLFQASNIVSSIEFDRDDEFFATAGVSRKIKVFEYSSVAAESADSPFPVMEMTSRSKLSCLSWNKYVKHHIASSDYEGIVTIWDVNTAQSIMEYEEHEKRAWSVDFSATEPSMLVSGSDDGQVKVWSSKQERSVLGIDMKANICCVKYNPSSSNVIAVGSADHNIHYYDLRKPQSPLHVFSGHRKAVSYVKFISPYEMVSASTDSTLRLWDVKDTTLTRVCSGHSNERNFVGLSANSEYITCGSETNEVFVYHKAMSRPSASHTFGAAQDSNEASHFISAVCWKSDSLTMLAANSQGDVLRLLLAAG